MTCVSELDFLIKYFNSSSLYYNECEVEFPQLANVFWTTKDIYSMYQVWVVSRLIEVGTENLDSNHMISSPNFVLIIFCSCSGDVNSELQLVNVKIIS
jgi:hypothetical protein